VLVLDLVADLPAEANEEFLVEHYSDPLESGQPGEEGALFHTRNRAVGGSRRPRDLVLGEPELEATLAQMSRDRMCLAKLVDASVFGTRVPVGAAALRPGAARFLMGPTDGACRRVFGAGLRHPLDAFGGSRLRHESNLAVVVSRVNAAPAPFSRRVAPRRSGRQTRRRVHPTLEVLEALLSNPLLLCGYLPSVLREDVKQDDQAARALVEDAVPRLGEANPQLSQLASTCELMGNAGGGLSGRCPLRCSSIWSSILATAIAFDSSSSSRNSSTGSRSFPRRSR